METIPKSNCREVGFFRKTHGVHGEMVLEYESEYEDSISESERFFVELDGLLVPFFIVEDGFRFKTTKTAILKFEDVNTENYARRLVRCPVFLFNEEIKIIEEEPLKIRFLDYLLKDESLGELGTIFQVDDFSGNIVFYIQYKNQETLIPFNEDFMVSVDEENKIITLCLPEGLLED